MDLNNLINQSQFQKYASALASQGLSDASIRRKLSALATFHKFLAKKKLTDPPTVIARNSYQSDAAISPSVIASPEGAAISNSTTNPSTPNRLKSFLFNRYFIVASVLLLLSGLGYTLYTQVFNRANKNLAYSSASALVTPNRILSFQGRLTDSSGNPITSSTGITFKLFTLGSGGTELYNSGAGNSQTVIPDENGIFSVVIGQSHGLGIASSVFSENAEVWLEITAGGETMNPRQQIATVGYALNSETLQGLPPSASGMRNTVLVIDGSGNLNLGETSPTIISQSGTLGIIGQAILIGSSDGSGGNITINPDGAGKLRFLTEGTGSTATGGLIEATNANLASGNLYSAYINNDNRGYNFLDFSNYNVGTTALSSRFSVDAYGNLASAGTINTSIGITTPRITISVGATSGYILQTDAFGNASWVNPGSAGIGTSYDAGNGLTKVGSLFKFGGALTENTRLNIGNTEVLYVNYATGNVGIGTTSPAYKFQVQGSSSDLYFTGDGTATLGTSLSSGGNISLYNSATGYMNFNANNTAGGFAYFVASGEKMRLTRDGNLGIGTTAPGYKLHVNGDALISTRLGIGATHPLYAFNVGGTSMLADIFSYGSLGLGTTAPTYKLELVGSNSIFRIGDTAGNTLVDISETSAQFNLPTTFTSTGDVNMANDLNFTNQTASTIRSNAPLYLEAGESFENNDLTLKTYGLGNIVFDSAGLTLLQAQSWTLATGTTNALNISNGLISIDTLNSRVGIGTSSPTKKLDVAGDINLTGTIYTTGASGSVGQVLTSTGSGLQWATNVGTTYTFQNGINLTGSNVGLGGTLTSNTIINTGANSISFLGLGNTQSLFIGASGYVGIGTTNPGSTLEVNGTSQFNNNLTIKNSAAILNIQDGNSATDFNIRFLDNAAGEMFNLGGATGTTDFYFKAGANKNWIFNSGNVGIGTTAPSKKFDIAGDINLTGTIFSNGTSGTSGQVLTSTGTGLSWVNAASVGGTYTFNNGITNNAGTVGLGGTLSSNTQIGTSSFEVNFIGLGGSQSLHINESGRVGIGVTNPTSTFQVVGNSLKISRSLGNVGGNLQIGNSSYAWTLIGNQYSGGDLMFKNPTNENIMYFSETSGLVGIGTTNPSKKLDVAGDINLTGTIFTTGTSGTSGQVLSSTGTGLAWINNVGTTYSFVNGLNLSGSNVGLGGTLNSNTSISTSTFGLGIGTAGNSLYNLSIGGTASLTNLTTSGNVGIGTTNTNVKLIIGNNLATGFIDSFSEYQLVAYESASAAGSYGIGIKPNTLVFNSGAGAFSFDKGGSSTSMLIDTSGNVGIGTTNPTKKLDVAGDINLTGTIFSAGVSGTNGQVLTSTGSGLQWVNAASVGGTYVFTNGLTNTAGTIGLGGTLTSNTLIGTSSFQTDFIGLGGTVALHIDKSGAIGIGTSSPIGKLEVISYSDNEALTLTAPSVLSNSAFSIRNLPLSTTVSNGKAFQFLVAGESFGRGVFYSDGSYGIGGGASTRDVFLSRSSANNLVIDSNRAGGSANLSVSGSIGIGTTSPSKKLDVAGDINLTGTIFATGASGTSGQVLSSTGTGLQWVNNVGTTYTFQNGINLSGSNVGLGGTLVSSTIINTGANSLSFLGLGNTQALFIGTSGYIGIGTTSPSVKLEVNGGIRFGWSGNSLESYYDANNRSGLRTYFTSATYSRSLEIYSYGQDADDAPIVFSPQGTPRMIVTEAGNVGIGTTSPTKKLDVTGDINLTGTIFSNGTSGSAGQVLTSTGVGLSWVPTSAIGSTYAFTNGLTNNANTVGLGGTLTSNTIINTGANSLSFLGLGNTQSLFIGASGYVGIGTTSQEKTLDIYNPTISTIRINTLGSGSGGIESTLELVEANNSGFKIYNDAPDNYLRIAGGSGSWTDILSIGKTSGNVGINTLAPSAKLHVVGTGSSHIAIFDGSGNVGIGTTDPTKKLDVTGDINLTGTIFATGISGSSGQVLTSTGTGLQWINAASVGGTYTFTNGLTNTAGTVGLGGTLTSTTKINTGANSLSFLGLGNSQSLFISTSGYVGIGTTNPGAKLEVVGRIWQTGTGKSVFLGERAGASDDLSDNLNVFVGYEAGYSNSTGYENTALGYNSLYSNTTGSDNTALGYFSLGSNTTGYNNSALGDGAGTYATNGAQNETSNTSLYLGTNTKAFADGDSNEIVIGYDTTGFGSDTIAYGNASMTKHIFQAGNVGIGNTNPTKKLHIVGDIQLTGTVFVGAGVTGSNGQILASDGAGGLQWVADAGGTGGSSYTATNGLTLTGSAFGLGGTLTQTTQIGTSSFNLSFIGLGGTTALFIGNTGFVGIGASNPGARLEIFSRSTTEAELLRLTNSAYTVNQQSAINFYIGDTFYKRMSSIKSRLLTATGSTTTADLGFYTSNDDTTPQLKMTLDNFGNLGLGTSNPLAKLHLIGTGTTHLAIFEGSGNFGIGTTNPSYKLEIAGSTNNYLSYIYNTGTTSNTGGLNVRSDGLGNIFNANYAGTDLFTVSPAQTTINNPANFTSAGDISAAYDLNFTNASSSTIRSSAPLYLTSGEVFNSSNLNLTTYNSGRLVLDTPGGVILSQAQNWTLGNGTTSTTALNIQSGLLNLDTTNSRIGIGTTAPSKRLDVAGDIKLTGSVFVGAGVTGASGQVLSSNGAGSLAWITPSDTTYTASNGVTISGSVIGLGGSLTQNTTIGTSSFLLNIDGTVTAGKFASFTDPTNYFIDPSNSTSTNASTSLHGNGSVLFNTLTLGSTQVAITANSSTRLKSFANGFSIATNIGSTGVGSTINWSDSLFVANSGYIGIGTTAPRSRLDVLGTLTVGGTGNVGLYMRTDVDLDRRILFANAAGTYAEGNLNGNPLTFDISGVEAARFNSSGYLGIGTSDPLNLLDVNGISRFRSYLNMYEGTTASGKMGSAYSFIDVGGQSDIGILATDAIHFATNNASTTKMILTGAGNLGIGTSSPTGPLQINVNGTGGTMAFHIATNGKVGIGTSIDAAYQLDVRGTNGSGVAFVRNLQTGNTVPTLIVQTASVGLGTTGGEYIRFLNSTGAKVGRIRIGTAVTAVVYATGGANDLAEYMIANEPTDAADLISFVDGKFSKYTPGSVIAGIHSSYATLVGNENIADQPNAFPLAISGIVKLKVSTQNGPIRQGDPLAGSHLTATASKAIKAGHIVARALEGYSNPDPNQIGVIEVIVGLNWYDPDIMLTDSGEINVNHNISDEVLASLGYTASKNEIESAQYSINDSLGQPVTKIALFAQVTSAKIKTGLVSTTNLIAKNIVAETTKSKEVQTAVLTPLSDITDTIVVDGNLAVNGTLVTEKLESKEATISTLYAENIISKEGNFGQLMTDKITALREEIRNTISSIGVTDAVSTPSALVADAPNWTFNSGTSQTEITGDVALSDNIVIGSKLTVLGDTQLGNAFVTGTFTAGEIAIKENFIETTASVLHIQPSGLGAVHLMNDTLIIAENGEVTLNGNLAVTGNINSTSLFASLINSDEINTKKLTAESINVATASATPIIAESGFAALATTSAQVSTNATAGTATLPTGKTELVIYNEKITQNSIIYLTPVGSTNNQVVYLKSKNVSPTPTPESTSSATTPSSFVIALDSPLLSDVAINWWIIN